MPQSHQLECHMTKPRSKTIKPVSEPQPPGHEHLIGRYQRFPLPAISATPLRISHSPIRRSKGPLGKFTHADAGQMHLCLSCAREYQMLLPNEKLLAAKLEKTRHRLAARR